MMMLLFAIVVLLGIGFLFGPGAVMILVFLGVGLCVYVVATAIPNEPGFTATIVFIGIIIALGIGGFFAKVSSWLRGD